VTSSGTFRGGVKGVNASGGKIVTVLGAAVLLNELIFLMVWWVGGLW